MPMSRLQIDAPLQPHEAFGQVVRARRAELEISQEELGARCGLDRTYVSGIERGTRNPTIQSMWRIAKGLGSPLSDLLRQVERRVRRSQK